MTRVDFETNRDKELFEREKSFFVMGDSFFDSVDETKLRVRERDRGGQRERAR
jgi:hypothetical protein